MPVRCGDVLVNPGDIIFADLDGIVVVPKQLEHKLYKLVSDKVSAENKSRKELLEGKILREVYDKYGAL